MEGAEVDADCYEVIHEHVLWYKCYTNAAEKHILTSSLLQARQL